MEKKQETVNAILESGQGSASGMELGKALPPFPEGQNKQVEIGGPKGPEPTRYGDWENNGRCTDF